MSNKRLRDDQNTSKQKEVVKAHYVGATILIAAAAGFLLLIFALNRVFDFGRFAY